MPSPGLPSSMGEGSQLRFQQHPSQEDLSLSSILTSCTSCPSKAFASLISAQPGLGWVTKVTPFPSQLPVPEWTSWAGFLSRWEGGCLAHPVHLIWHSFRKSDIPSGSSSLNEAMPLSRDSGDDKLQGSGKKDHPGTMGTMGTALLALLERRSPGKWWYFTHYLWNYTECQWGRCYPLSQHTSNIRRNMEITYFFLFIWTQCGITKEGLPQDTWVAGQV